MRRPLFSWANVGAIPADADARTRLTQAASRLASPLQNVLIVLAASLVPTTIGLEHYSKLSATIAMLLLVTYRSKCGRYARMAQFFYGYALICAIFGMMRGLSDETPWAGAHLNAAWNIERSIFQEQLPSARLQRLFYDHGHTSWFDYAITAVYVSFFLVPVLAGVIVALRNWRRSRTMLIAQMFVFMLGFLAITAWPSNPPWLTTDSALSPSSTEENQVYRVTTITLGQGDDYAYGADKNRIAAMPSIHLANTFLVLLLLWAFGRKWRLLGGAYVAIMAFAVVYLGEHYVIDAVAGIALSLGAWRLALAWQSQWRDAVVARLQVAVAPALAGAPRFGRSDAHAHHPAFAETHTAELG